MPMNSERTARNSGVTTSPSEPPEGGNDTASDAPEKAREIGGRKGPDPTRYGDWEKGGRCIDF